MDSSKRYLVLKRILLHKATMSCVYMREVGGLYKLIDILPVYVYNFLHLVLLLAADIRADRKRDCQKGGRGKLSL